MGQEDLISININQKIAIKLLREKVGQKIIGLSTHNLKEIKDANLLDIDYIGLGAYRRTNTKESVTVSGKKLLEIAKNSKHKVALIGGIKLEDNFKNHPQIEYKVIGSNLMEYFLSNL